MDKQKRNIAIIGVVALLAIVVIYLNFFSGGSSDVAADSQSDLQKAIESGDAQAQPDTAAAPAPTQIIKPSGGTTVRINP